MSKKLACVVTGKVTTFSDENYLKKIEELGSEHALKARYVCKAASQLLAKGYSSKEIRCLLKQGEHLPDVDDHTLTDHVETRVFSDGGIKKSDPDVADFITRIKNATC
jgi:hypothetical protein